MNSKNVAKLSKARTLMHTTLSKEKEKSIDQKEIKF